MIPGTHVCVLAALKVSMFVEGGGDSPWGPEVESNVPWEVTVMIRGVPNEEDDDDILDDEEDDDSPRLNRDSD